MRIAHIIMAHKNPKQLLRLIKRLEHPNFDIYIHLDKKIPIEEFDAIKNSNATFIEKRIDCNWGGFSFLKAIFGSVTEVLHSGKHYDFINLLSAQDYPIVTPNKLLDHLLANRNTNFIFFEPQEVTDWWRDAILRVEKYHFNDFIFKGRFLFQNLINTLAPKRKFPLNMKLYGGSKSSWWTITGDCANHINTVFQNDSKLRKFLKYSWGTDEFAIATLIMNSEFKSNCVNNNLRYIDFSDGLAHPKTLLTEDFKKIINSNMLFARKFDDQVDENILQLIDNELLRTVQ